MNTIHTAANGDIAYRMICLGMKGLVNPKEQWKMEQEVSVAMIMIVHRGLQAAVHWDIVEGVHGDRMEVLAHQPIQKLVVNNQTGLRRTPRVVAEEMKSITAKLRMIIEGLT